MILLWGLRDFEHRRAVNALAARTYQGADPLRVSAYPALADPFHWYGVVETPDFFALAPVDSLGPEVDPEGRSRNPLQAGGNSDHASRQAFLSRTCLPRLGAVSDHTDRSPQSPGGGYIVNFQDLRFVQLPSLLSRRGEPRRALGAGVQLDKNLHVVGDVYGSGEKRRTVPEPD